MLKKIRAVSNDIFAFSAIALCFIDRDKEARAPALQCQKAVFCESSAISAPHLEGRIEKNIQQRNYSVAEVIGFIKGKSSIWIAQNIERKAKNFTGHKFWARGYFVSTVGRDEETIRAYIRNQELQDRQMDQLALIP